MTSKMGKLPRRQTAQRRIVRLLRTYEGCRADMWIARQVIKILEDMMPALSNEWAESWEVRVGKRKRGKK